MVQHNFAVKEMLVYTFASGEFSYTADDFECVYCFHTQTTDFLAHNK